MRKRAKNRTIRDYYEHEILTKCLIQLLAKNIRFIDDTDIQECTEKQVLKKYVEEFGHNPITEHRKDISNRKHNNINRSQIYVTYSPRTGNVYFEQSTLGYNIMKKRMSDEERDILYSNVISDRKHFLSISNKYSEFKRGGKKSTAFSLSNKMKMDIENDLFTEVLPEHEPTDKELRKDFFKRLNKYEDRKKESLSKKAERTKMHEENRLRNIQRKQGDKKLNMAV